MADDGGFGGVNFGDLGGAVSSLFGAAGDFSEASAYSKAQSLAETSAKISAESSNIQQYMERRKLLMTTGAQQAGYGASGLKQSGSAVDVLRASMQQGALANQVIKEQGMINVNSYETAADQYGAEASAANAAGAGGILGGIMKGVGAFASMAALSDARLKEGITYVGPSGIDGVNVYTFRYIGQPRTYEGVMAQEVKRVRPDAVFTNRDGFMAVNYAALGVHFKLVA